ncbi:MAG TPA: hypothetical protein VGS22_16245 [Thermoanaerobaculia bacterium]|jgi:hypothetical protein|nr:hypothetical protein [Thermoanaerobaculia bacterium]
MPQIRRPNDRLLAPLALFALVCCFLFAAIPGWGLPTITVDKKGLLAQGITPGGRAIWWSVAHEHPDSFVTIVHRLEEQADTDLDGVVSFEHEGDLPETSLWLVIDVSTGGYATFAPEDFGVTEIPLPPEAAVETGGRGTADAFREVARPLVEVLLVRAGQGVWTLRAGDGGATDQDDFEGEISFGIDGMTPVGTSPLAPSRYAEGDRLLSIDIDRLELSSLVVETPPPPGAAAARVGVQR